MLKLLNGNHVFWSSSLEHLQHGNGIVFTHFSSVAFDLFSSFFSMALQASFASSVEVFRRSTFMRRVGPGISPCRNK
jgi:hypothetical protein